MSSIKHNGLVLAYVPNEYLDEEICIEAVKQNSYALDSVPKKYITKEMCITAIKQNGLALQYVPKKYLDDDIISLANNKPKSIKREVPINNII